MNKTILVTGATSGFGKAIAKRFAQDGDDMIITGRREELLMELSAALREEYMKWKKQLPRFRKPGKILMCWSTMPGWQWG